MAQGYPEYCCDFNRATKDMKFDELNIDRMIFNAGIWNVNDGNQQPFAIYLGNIRLSYNKDIKINIDGMPVNIKPDEDIWWRNKITPNKNIAGEHRYHIETKTRYWIIDE